MARPTAAHLILHVSGTSLWGDSAYSPEQPVIVVRLPFGGRDAGPESSRCDVDGGPTIGPDGTIYVGGDGIHAVWPDGTLRWKLATAEHVASTPALGADGTVYAGSQDDNLFRIDAPPLFYRR